MTPAFVVNAIRTAVAPREGAFRNVDAFELGAVALCALLPPDGLPQEARVEVVMGNALYGGGNPARVAALAAGFSEAIPACTIDTQCCGGLDAIALGASRIRAGETDIVLACGLESYSQAPLRYRKSRIAAEPPQAYTRPPFTPWKDRDPDMTFAAARLAAEFGITREAQEAFAIESHRKALVRADAMGEIAPVSKTCADTFARKLSSELCARLPVVAGVSPYALTAATIAVEADAAAAVLLVNEHFISQLASPWNPMRITGAMSRGFNPERPALAPIDASRELLRRHAISAEQLDVVEIMEAYAVQAIAFNAAFSLDPTRVNRGGGALVRGHPIGASGAILAVRLFHELQHEKRGARGLAAIAAAGGLASAMLLEKN